jgi:pilus assembly protein CpaF
MKEQASVEQPAALKDIPVLAEYDKELSRPATSPRPSTTPTNSQPFGVYSSDELRSSTAQLPTGDLDWGQVVDLRRRASEIITEEAEEYARSSGRPLVSEDRLLLGRSTIRRVVADHVRSLHRSGAELWSPAQEEAYVTAVEDSIFGYGRLQPLLEMPDVENIEIHGWDSVVVQFGDGSRRRMRPVAESDAELVEAIRFLGQNSEPSRPFDDTHPTMTLAIGERFRLHAMGFGLSYRPSIVIRQHTLTDVSLADLADGGLMPYAVAQFLDAAILARKSMVIAGDQGAGKTTLLRALINSIPFNERFGTLETDYELMTHLQPGRENILALQARVGHGETSGGTRIGDFTISELVPEALRQNLSRLVIGEVRGGEASAMFEAMQAGTGTLSTTHSHSAESTMDRLASRVAQSGVLTVEEAICQ